MRILYIDTDLFTVTIHFHLAKLSFIKQKCNIYVTNYIWLCKYGSE